MHHIHALNITKIESGNPDDIGVHVHWDGRYSFNSELQAKDFN